MKKLNTGHLFKVVAIFGKVGNDIKPVLKDDLNEMEFGITLITSALKYAENDIKDLLADIAELNSKDFDEQPFDFILDLLEELAEKEDLHTFFTRAKRLAFFLSKNK